MIGKRLQIAIGLLLCGAGLVIGHLINSVYGTMIGNSYVSMNSFLPIIALLGIVYGTMLNSKSRDLAFELTVCIGMGLALCIGGAYPNKLKLGLALMGIYYLAVILALGAKYARHKRRS